ncbi:hypothetical protein P8452_30783 [Trifolium repens]|nr:hypothetical protein P8452_30783 [Trifolium repens]
MSFLSVLVLFLAVISLTKQQIHVQSNGLISNKLPTIELHTSGTDNRRSLLQAPPSIPIPKAPRTPLSQPLIHVPRAPPITPPERILLARGPPSIRVPPAPPMPPPPPEQ